MKIREEKQDDKKNAITCAILIEELIKTNDRFDHNVWVAGMMACIFDGFSNGRVSRKVFREYLTKYIDSYDEVSEAWEPK